MQSTNWTQPNYSILLFLVFGNVIIRIVLLRFVIHLFWLVFFMYVTTKNLTGIWEECNCFSSLLILVLLCSHGVCVPKFVAAVIAGARINTFKNNNNIQKLMNSEYCTIRRTSPCYCENGVLINWNVCQRSLRELISVAAALKRNKDEGRTVWEENKNSGDQVGVNVSKVMEGRQSVLEK